MRNLCLVLVTLLTLILSASAAQACGEGVAAAAFYENRAQVLFIPHTAHGAFAAQSYGDFGAQAACGAGVGRSAFGLAQRPIVGAPFRAVRSIFGQRFSGQGW